MITPDLSAGESLGSATITTKVHSNWYDTIELKWAARQWAARMGVKVTQIHIRQMNSKWASMSTAGRLTLNYELVELEKTLGEFVIVHELVHLLVPNHGKIFKSFMYAYLPDWEERERQLQSQAQSKVLLS